MIRRAAALAVALLLAAGTARGFDPAKTPVTPVPAERRGGWLPGSVLLDSSHYSGHCDSSICLRSVPISYDVQATPRHLYIATGRGVSVFTLADPLRPQRIAVSYFPEELPIWFASDKDWFFSDLHALDDGLVALAGEDQGFVVWSVAGGVHYQQTGGFVGDVYAATVAGKRWAWGLDTTGVTLYDLDVAAPLNRCEDTVAAPACGVRRLLYADSRGGPMLTGAGERLAATNGARVQAWDIAAPLAPRRLVDVQLLNRGLALWRAASGDYRLAVSIPGAGSTTVRVYALGESLAEIGSVTVPTYGMPIKLTASQATGRDWLSVGGQSPTSANCSPQQEFIFDVTNPAAPREVTPQVHPGGYWGWYYQGCPTGFNSVTGMASVVAQGGFVYRAAFGAADVHRMPLIFASGFEGGRW